LKNLSNYHLESFNNDQRILLELSAKIDFDRLYQCPILIYSA